MFMKNVLRGRIIGKRIKISNCDNFTGDSVKTGNVGILCFANWFITFGHIVS